MQTRCPTQAIILQQQLLILVHLGASYGRMIDFCSAGGPKLEQGKRFKLFLRLCNTFITLKGCSIQYMEMCRCYPVIFVSP